VALKEDLLSKAFDVWWPKLEESLNKIKEKQVRAKASEDLTTKALNITSQILNEEILEEILEISRTNQKILRDPDALFPKDLFERKTLSEYQKTTLIRQRHMGSVAIKVLDEISIMLPDDVGRTGESNENFYDEYYKKINIIKDYIHISNSNILKLLNED
jgi:hypothetical protein